jgi:hypothetical protein
MQLPLGFKDILLHAVFFLTGMRIHPYFFCYSANRRTLDSISHCCYYISIWMSRYLFSSRTSALRIMSDEETLPVEGPQVAKSLRLALECPVCLDYMEPPITMCSSGHSVCRACKPRLFCCPTCRQPLLGIRNFALESLARELQLSQHTTEAPPLPCSSDLE